jgi:hypothetical protein
MRFSQAWVLASVLALGGCAADKFDVADAGSGSDGSASDGGASDGSASDGSASGTIICKGPGTCPTATTACCLRFDQVDDQCIARPATGSTECPNISNSALLMCDDPSDCASGVCCGAPTGNGFASACVSAASCIGSNKLVLCELAGPPSQCNLNRTCKPHPTIPRYGACQ